MKLDHCVHLQDISILIGGSQDACIWTALSATYQNVNTMAPWEADRRSLSVICLNNRNSRELSKASLDLAVLCSWTLNVPYLVAVINVSSSPVVSSQSFSKPQDLTIFSVYPSLRSSFVILFFKVSDFQYLLFLVSA
jgi:hypothetical protein